MFDRHVAFCLALLLATPLCLDLDDEIFAPAQPSAGAPVLRTVAVEGLQARRREAAGSVSAEHGQLARN